MKFELTSLIAPGAMLAFLLYLRWAARHAARVNGGLELANRGAYAEALAHYEEQGRRWTRTGIERLNRGMMLLRLWRPEEAHQLLAEVVRKPTRAERPYVSKAKDELAIARALMGSTPKEGARQDAGQQSPLAVLATAILAARQRHFDEVRLLMVGREAYLLQGTFRALAEVLLAWSQLELEGKPNQRISLACLWGGGGPGTLPQSWPELLEAVDRLQPAAEVANPIAGGGAALESPSDASRSGGRTP